MKGSAIFLVICVTASFAATAVHAQESLIGCPSVGEMVQEYLWLRPLGLIWSFFGAVAYGVSYPVTREPETATEAQQFFIQDPRSFTFERPFMEF